MATVIPYTCPAGTFRVGAFGRTWTQGFAVQLDSGSLMANGDGSIMCFRAKGTALIVAASIVV